jgi:hypothetical protein
MEVLKRVRVVLVAVTLVVTLFSALPGCGGESGDPLKASDGTPLKTPSEIREAAQAKYSTLHPETKATNLQPATKATKGTKAPK